MSRSSSSQAIRRGRPKGTGIDDEHQLRRLVIMMKADKDLNPTTAIRSIGVNNASVIRRLRDKLKESKPNQAKPSAPPALTPKSALPAPKHVAKSKQKRQPVQQQARKVRAPAKRKAASEINTAPPAGPKPTAPPPPQAEPLKSTSRPAPETPNPGHQPQPYNVDALRLTLQSAVAMARLQRELFDHAMATTPLGLIFRAQGMFAEFLATAMLAHQAMLQKPLATETK